MNISGKKITLFLHLLLWAILLILPPIIIPLQSENSEHILESTYVQIISYALIFYLNYFILIPQLFLRKKKIYYFISTAFFILLLSLLIDFFGQSSVPPLRPLPEQIPPDPGPDFHQPKTLPLYNFLLTSFLVTGFSLGLRFSEKLAKNEKDRKETEKEKINAELVFLKSQMNPHFFFNTMNNIYALVSSKSEDAPRAILRLSKLMRYMLYDTQQGNTLLGQEIEFMKNYFDLVRLRFSEKVILNVHFPDSYAYISIPPLLFIPFIENAFKHGVSYNETCFINITLKVKENQIFFSCVNTVFEKESTPNTASGIGLENIKKRLALLFGEKHELKILQQNQNFEVYLHINLTETT